MKFGKYKNQNTQSLLTEASGEMSHLIGLMKDNQMDQLSKLRSVLESVGSRPTLTEIVNLIEAKYESNIVQWGKAQIKHQSLGSVLSSIGRPEMPRLVVSVPAGATTAEIEIKVNPANGKVGSIKLLN